MRRTGDWLAPLMRVRSDHAMRRGGKMGMGRRGVARPSPTRLDRPVDDHAKMSPVRGRPRQSRPPRRVPARGRWRDGSTCHIPRVACSPPLPSGTAPRRGRRSPGACGRIRRTIGRLDASARRCGAFVEPGAAPGLTSDDIALDPDVVSTSRADRADPSDAGNSTPTRTPFSRCSARPVTPPDWDDEWLIADRERIRQMRLNALELLSERRAAGDGYGPAVEAALMAIATTAPRKRPRTYPWAPGTSKFHDALGQYATYRDSCATTWGWTHHPRWKRLSRDSSSARVRPMLDPIRRARITDSPLAWRGANVTCP